jgi:hypothetical protein
MTIDYLVIMEKAEEKKRIFRLRRERRSGDLCRQERNELHVSFPSLRLTYLR